MHELTEVSRKYSFSMKMTFSTNKNLINHIINMFLFAQVAATEEEPEVLDIPLDYKVVHEHPGGLQILQKGASAWPLYVLSPKPIAALTVLVKEEGGSAQSDKPADDAFVDMKIRATTPIVYNDKASCVFVCLRGPPSFTP